MNEIRNLLLGRQGKAFNIVQVVWLLGFGTYLDFACLPRPRSGPGPVGREFVIWSLDDDLSA